MIAERCTIAKMHRSADLSGPGTRRPVFGHMVKFALVGVVNTAVDVGLFWVLQAVLGVPYLIANVISYSAGTLNSFVLNKVWTFAETRHGGVVRQQLPLFFAIAEQLDDIGMMQLL